MTLKDILNRKGSDVHTVGPDVTLREVVDDMVRYNVGSLVICESISKGADVQMIGIVTERDVLRFLAHGQTQTLDDTRVAEIMSDGLIIACPSDPLEKGMGLMTHHRVRHLPIVADGQLWGVVSIGDIVKAQDDELVMDNQHMSRYIQGDGGEIAARPSPLSSEHKG